MFLFKRQKPAFIDGPNWHFIAKNMRCKSSFCPGKRVTPQPVRILPSVASCETTLHGIHRDQKRCLFCLATVYTSGTLTVTGPYLSQSEGARRARFACAFNSFAPPQVRGSLPGALFVYSFKAAALFLERHKLANNGFMTSQ